MAVGSASTALRRMRRQPTPAHEPVVRSYRLSPGRRVQLRRVARYAISVVLAGTAATLLGIGHPYWAMVSAVVPVGAGTFAAGLARGTHRILGTTVGVLLAAAVLLLDPGDLVIVLLVGLCSFGVELLVGRNYGIAMVFVTPLALLAVHLATRRWGATPR